MTIKTSRNILFGSLLTLGLIAGRATADDAYLEPGTLRLSNLLSLENLFHRVSSGLRVENTGINKTYSQDNTANHPWKTEWGQSLLTEAATRLTPDFFGRALFQLQGDYADRYWRPVNYEHETDDKDGTIFLRQAEANIDKEAWFLHGFIGVGHNDWSAQGDVFGLYPASYPDSDYLGSSGYFGVYPSYYKQDQFLNIGRHPAPKGAEAGAQFNGMDAGVAYGDELQWGYHRSAYGRISTPLQFQSSKLNFVYKDEKIPWSLSPNEHQNAYALDWNVPSPAGHNFDLGVLYQPFRIGQTYQVARDASAGTGVLGSSTGLGQHTTKEKDAFAEKMKLVRHSTLFDRDWVWNLNLDRAEILAGNKEQIDMGFATDITSVFKGYVQYTYRRPVEGAIPFLYEGTPGNIGAIVANPRGPDAPFTVDWNNREAVFFETTFVYDPTPGTNLFLYEPRTLQTWNLNPAENARFAMAFQYRMSDYRGGTDRQYYFDQEGRLIWEPAGHSGAWPTEHPLSQVRVLAFGKKQKQFMWTLGVAGGQAPAIGGIAYNPNAENTSSKPITDFYSIEGRLEGWPWTLWAHYAWGVWGPESSYQPFFGESFDRLWGLGVSYKITATSTVDVNYVGARQDDNQFFSPELGSYDEIRTIFTYRFGYLFQFNEAQRAGYQAH